MTQPKSRGLLSGATIRDSLIRVLRPLFKTQTPDKTAKPAKAHGMLPIQRKGKDSKKPSMRPIRIPLEPAERSPPRSKVPLRPAGQSPPRSRVADLPSSRRPISAPLEGSGSTLGQPTDHRLARGNPSAQKTNSPAAQPLAVRRH